MTLPNRKGESVQFSHENGRTITVECLQRGEYVARYPWRESPNSVRWGNTEEMRSDVQHFLEFGERPARIKPAGPTY